MNHFFSVDQKLELMRQIRSRYQRDRYDMFHRERLLYGKTSPYPVEEGEYPETEEPGANFSTLPLRALLALGLFLLIVICDMSGRSFLGIQAAQCFSAISENYDTAITAWVESVSADGKMTGSDMSGSGADADASANTPPAGSRP